MTISEMHTTFRTIGQQAGMQLIRGILPESIDVYLNQSINEKVRNVVMVNSATPFHDRVAIQDNSISPINSLRSISKKKSIDITGGIGAVDFYTISMTTLTNVMFYTSFGVRYSSIKKRVGIRFIESDKLDDTRSDYCNRESWDYPIVTMFNNDTTEYVELYIDNITKNPSKLEVSYIELPTIVKFSTNVNCNLPVYLHPEIVEMAVDRFFKSVGYTTKQVARN